ncbi:hypothetical protein L1987_52643 [Smallanthus sonchifolius]|uniref:Uncharacterized protein n=1 Tax=Smallanthus sonchifolius TaxID=185202 RepID=A0ACB9ET24_9ASTR|nr:hypothetical protein L1987_52643 [Smallanthus sonchifolius]
MSDSDSSGSPGVQSLRADGGNSSSSVKETDGLWYAVASSYPRGTPLFSPEFKAMLGRDYPKTRIVFSPRAPLSGEAAVGRGLWDGIAPSQTVLDGESVSQLSDVHVHVPVEELEPMSEVHGVQDGLGTNLVSGFDSETVHAHVVNDGGPKLNEVKETTIHYKEMTLCRRRL